MTRRELFGMLLGGVASASALDPEEMLWVPGKKLISIPVLIGAGKISGKKLVLIRWLEYDYDNFTNSSSNVMVWKKITVEQGSGWYLNLISS